MNCPKCGAKELKSDRTVIYGDSPRFACGTTFGGIDGSYCMANQLRAAEKELCDLRKWREVVLSKTEATLGGVYSMMTKTPDKFGTVAEMFDSAVRKEMECES